jgi:hypothetical protein
VDAEVELYKGVGCAVCDEREKNGKIIIERRKLPENSKKWYSFQTMIQQRRTPHLVRFHVFVSIQFRLLQE